jgi:hypothetical protein
MNKISNYEELIAERRFLENKIRDHKTALKDGLTDLINTVEPFTSLIPVLNVFKKKDSDHSMVKFITSMGIDVLVGQKLMAKSNWVMRLVVPMLLKGASAIALKIKSKQATPKLIAEE